MQAIGIHKGLMDRESQVLFSVSLCSKPFHAWVIVIVIINIIGAATATAAIIVLEFHDLAATYEIGCIVIVIIN